MFKTSRQTRRVVAALVLMLALGRTAFGDEAAGEASQVRILMVIDTKAENGQLGFERDRDNLSKLLVKKLKEQGLRYSLQILQGANATPKKVLDHYAALPVKADEALLFYYSGHGSFVPGKGQVFNMTHGTLARSKLREAMMKHHPRLAVVLTDCCSTGSASATANEGKGPPPAEVALPTGSGSVVRDLFFRHKGLVLISAAKIGQNASGSVTRGGNFTSALATMLSAPVSRLDKDRNGLVEWREFFPQVRQETQRLATSDHADHTPQAFYLAQRFRK